jgi:hypothetical protein
MTRKSRKSRKSRKTRKTRKTRKSRETGRGYLKKILTRSKKSFEEQRLDAMSQQKKDYEKCMKDDKGTTKIVCKQFENILDDYFTCIEENKRLNYSHQTLNQLLDESKEEILMYERREEIYERKEALYTNFIHNIMQDSKYSKDSNKLFKILKKEFPISKTFKIPDKKLLEERVLKFTKEFNSPNNSLE